MPTFKARGVVIKTSDWSETSRIASIFTREHGRIRVLAKGGRRVNSTFEISLDLLNVIDVVFIHKSHGGLDLLTEARIAERFPQLRKNINALYAGYYLAELLSEGLQDMDPHPDLFDSALSTLRQFETQDDWLSLISQFELVWLTELGYTPRVDACASCGVMDDLALPNDRFAIGLDAGGVLCNRCRAAARDARSLSGEAFRCFCDMVDRQGGLEARFHGELRPLLGSMICHTLGRRPKLMSYVEQSK
jgi:DNA repair protein RecO (recombination protein O)